MKKLQTSILLSQQEKKQIRDGWKKLEKAFNELAKEKSHYQSQPADESKNVFHNKIQQKLLEALSKKEDCLHPDIHSRTKGLIEIMDEPGIFSEEEREPIWPEMPNSSIIEKLLRVFNERLPNRENQIKILFSQFFNFSMGSKVSRTPLLIGPPGTGKTYVAEVLKDTLKEAKITSTVYKVCGSQARSSSDEFDMKIFGSSIHWANGMPSPITYQVIKKENRLVILLIDEVEKSLANNLASLLIVLDPHQSFEDKFLQEVFPEFPHDRRFKIFTILTCNNEEAIRQIPELWDRLIPIYFPAYSKEEMLEIAISQIPLFSKVIKKEISDGKLDIKKIGMETLKDLDKRGIPLTLRYLMDTLERNLLTRIFPQLEISCSHECSLHKKPRIGF